MYCTTYFIVVVNLIFSNRVNPVIVARKLSHIKQSGGSLGGVKQHFGALVQQRNPA